VLAACGVAGTKGTGAPAEFDWRGWWVEQRKQGTLDWANWPLYIDTVGIPPQVFVMGTLIFLTGVLFAIAAAVAQRRDPTRA
jgi:hypothetical protein